jgi:outer membrane protein assembly factor BamB
MSAPSLLRDGRRRSCLIAVLAPAGLSALAGCGSMPWSASGRTVPPPPSIARGSFSLRTRWTAPFPGGVNLAPAVTESGVWVASSDGRLALLDPGKGTVRWAVNVARSIAAGVGARGALGVVATADGDLAAFDDLGKQLWKVALGAEAVTVPAVTGRGIYVRCSDRRTLAFERSTGRRLWSFPRTAPNLVLRQTSMIGSADGRLFVGFPGGRLAALDELTGSQVWETAVAVPRGSNEIERIADVVGVPSVASRDVCAVAFQGRIACFDNASGRMIWNRELSSAGGLAGTASVIAVSDEQGNVHAFSRTGSSLWRQTALAGRSPSTPAFAGSRLILSDLEGFVYALSLDDGAIEARSPTDGNPVAGAPLVAGDLALVQTTGGALHAFTIGAQ